MSLMECVREIRADEAHVDETELDTARQALLREIAGAERRPARRRLRLGVGLAGLAAASAVGAIVIANTIAPPESAAAAVFEEAAEVAVTGEAFDVPAGSYLRVSADSESLVPWDVDMPDETSRFNNGNVADAEAVLQLQGTTELYLPSDRSGDWIQTGGETELVATYGERADQALAEFTSQDGRFGGEPTMLIAPGGVYQAPGAFGETDHTYYLDSREYWAEQPTDPHELLAWLRTSMGETDPDSAASDSSIVETLTDSIGNAAAPPERRAAWLRVLALLDGSTVESVEGDVTTIRFSWSTEWWDAWTLIEIDTARGVVLGVTKSGAQTGADVKIDGLPQWGSRTTFTYDVVDAAPALVD
ncbi:hypothetical protein E4U02_02710 [Microbacterium paludicola]|uniref:Uncharacterized protein n=1 Tax=Microbacterium paludicola TaxID=300019 RepID=A0A4Y9G0P4_9MICO|nr:hypothetical protein [Microbacterium paludicola]MBF0815322.1 hypothetical protein [Microbacterium paludicola]TFU34182.1 hypothetical protein E4U02_02710 [Microbacterium paludicola]